MSNPLPEVTRVRGGGSARIGAVVVAVVLVGIVWVGISGRPAPGPVAVVATGSAQAAQAAPTSTQLPILPFPTPVTTPPPTPGPGETYGASLAIGNIRYVTILSELEPGHLTGELHFPSPPRLPTGTFAFSELWKDGHVDAAVAINEWAVDLAALATATRTPAAMVAAIVPAQNALLEVPSPVTRGYSITVDGTNDLLFSRMSIEVLLGEGRSGDDGNAASTARLGVQADVGPAHRELILAPGENGSFKGTFTLPRPKRATTGQLRLYNVQMTVSHGVWASLGDFAIDLTPDMARVGVSKLLLEQSDPAYRIVARTHGNVRGQSITVTVIARRVTASE
jgi:hypothetical protein